MSNSLDKLEQTLGINFKDKKLLLDAVTHRSFLNENAESIQSNERLEFLGDAVLELLVSDYLFKRFTDFPEGKLTNLRSAIVNTKTLGEIGKTLKFGDYLRLSKGEEAGGGRTNSSLLADVFEAVLGAIFIDQGIEVAKKFLDKQLYPQTSEILSIGIYNDYKSMLQEKAQEKFRITPTYEVIKEEGPDHNKTFYSKVLIGDKKLGEGKGKSKQEAEQDAARAGLEQWEAK